MWGIVINHCTLCSGVQEPKDKVHYIGNESGEIVVFYSIRDGIDRDLFDDLIGESALYLPVFRCSEVKDTREAANKCLVFNNIMLSDCRVLVVNELACHTLGLGFEFEHGKAKKVEHGLYEFIVMVEWEKLKGNKDEIERISRLFERVRKSL